MSHQTQIAPATAELLGDLAPLIEQLGSTDGLASLTDALASLSQLHAAADLQSFLQNYHAKILRPLELPAIQRAFNHAARNELRELIAYDRQIAGESLLQNFSHASRRAGQNQLLRLRPLRDHRLVQRYLAAVEQGEANGWHTLVYGLTLSVFSLPLRQGLCAYANQITRGFIDSAARTLALSQTESNQILNGFSATIPATIESLFADSLLA
ncbi:MAG TPA: urease accessory UreF family protein [Verrucomicrobiae bacterium]|jgi:urease accessory protein UreF|nr:urease accessory UreF family protein [Verrucomicrobiae bacterium]